MVRKGIVTSVSGNTVRITENQNVTPFINANKLYLKIGDTVAFVMFNDGTGIVLAVT